MGARLTMAETRVARYERTNAAVAKTTLLATVAATTLNRDEAKETLAAALQAIRVTKVLATCGE